MISSTLRDLVVDIQQHPAFKELLTAIPKPQIPRFRDNDASDAMKAFGKWANRSGQLEQHEAWMALLTGESSPDLTKTKD